MYTQQGLPRPRTQKGLRGNKPLTQGHCLYKVGVGIQGCHTKCAEREVLEQIIELEGCAPPRFGFTCTTSKLLRTPRGKLKGKETLSLNSLPGNLKKYFSHIIISLEFPRTPRVTAIKIDLGSFICEFNFPVPNMEAQWLCFTASEGTYRFGMTCKRQNKKAFDHQAQWNGFK